MCLYNHLSLWIVVMLDILPPPRSVQDSIAWMQICQHSKFVHIPETIPPCFVPVLHSCPQEPLPLVYSLAPSTVAYFPSAPITQQATDDRGYASAESSPASQVCEGVPVCMCVCVCVHIPLPSGEHTYIHHTHIQ